MTQFSMLPWTTGVSGDGSAPYTQEQSNNFFRYFDVRDPADEGVALGVLSELEVSGSSSPLTVAPGAAVCYGRYWSDANVGLSVSTPGVGTTGGRVVLRCTWSTRQIRLAVKMSSNGIATPPNLTQSFGNTWEISLATFTITTGGAITVTDDRAFRKATFQVDADAIADNAVSTAKIANGSVSTDKLADDAVTNAKLRNSAGVSVIGRASNSSGDPADILAAANDRVLARQSDAVGFYQVSTDMLADNSVNDTKVGERVPQFYRRQGGDSANWLTPGTTSYTPAAVRMQAGSKITSSIGSGSMLGLPIVFPVAFSNTPLLFLSIRSTTGLDCAVVISGGSETSSGFTADVHNNGGSSGTFVVEWLAIGPE